MNFIIRLGSALLSSEELSDKISCLRVQSSSSEVLMERSFPTKTSNVNINLRINAVAYIKVSNFILDH